METPDAPSTADIISHALKPGSTGSVLEEDNSEVWTFGDDRVMAGVDRIVTDDTMRKLRSGYECLRCWEPQISAFPLACDFCGYEMRQRQIHDIALEVKDGVHLGPSKPIGDYIDILDEEAERKKFARKIHEGGSRRRMR